MLAPAGSSELAPALSSRVWPEVASNTSNAPPELLIRHPSCCACVQLDLGETFEMIMMMMIVGPI